MNRRSLILIAIGLIAIIVMSSVIVYELGLMSSNAPSSILWQRPIENSATALAVDDGKVFMTDDHGNILCFDSHNGELVWDSSIYLGTLDSYSPYGAWLAHKIVVSGNHVLVAIENGRISCFDKDNGTFLWTFRNPDYFVWSPNIIVKDDMIFAITNGISAHDAITGALLWEANPILENFDAPESYVILLGGDFVDGKFVYGTGGDASRMRFYKMNAENGTVIWRSSATWDGRVLTWGAGNLYVPRVVASDQGKIIIQIIFEGTSHISHFFCLDSTSGKELWSIYIGEVGQPLNTIVYENLFILAKTDGYIYAVNLADGSIEWKTKVDTQDLLAINSPLGNSVLTSIQIDARNQRLFWYLNVAESGPSDNYTGTLCNLNVSDGNVNWIKNINPGFIGFKYSSSIGFNEETGQIFLPKNRGLWIFDASSGELLRTQEQFEHCIFPPMVLGNETFVVADLWLFAYS